MAMHGVAFMPCFQELGVTILAWAPLASGRCLHLKAFGAEKHGDVIRTLQPFVEHVESEVVLKSYRKALARDCTKNSSEGRNFAVAQCIPGRCGIEKHPTKRSFLSYAIQHHLCS